MNASALRFSVVIPTLHSPALDRTLRALLDQSYPPDRYEIIVVGQDQATLLSDPKVHFDPTERPYSPAAARNRGARQAAGEIVAFIDSDCSASPNWLATLDAAFADPAVHAVGGGVRFETGNYWTVADNISMFHEFLAGQPAGPRDFLPSLNFAVRRDVFLAAGGFDEQYPIPAGEDTDLTLRLTRQGHRLWFEPEAWVLHQPPRNSLAHLVRHAYHQGRYTPKVKPEHAGRQGAPFVFRSPAALLAASPLLAAAAALRVFLRQPRLVKYVWTLPAIMLAKWVWCLGAARSPVFDRRNPARKA